MCKFETDNRVLDEFLAESAPFVGVFDTFLVANAGEAETLDDDTDTFVIEVCHDNWKITISN
jgi:hypothetical protein